MDARFRSLDPWPHPATPTSKRRQSPFQSSWRQTLSDLDYELTRLKARDVIIGAGFRPGDIRLDGWPRADARSPTHPGVELSFTSARLKDRRLIYATDVCRRWEDNVRSIALGLESLRAVDRYGITARGEQYAGFSALPAATALGPVMDEDAALSILADAAGADVGRMGAVDLRRLFRRAAGKAHPDAGGSREDWDRVQAAGRVLGIAS